MICRIENCGRKLFVSELCRTHHRWWKSGRPLNEQPRIAKYDSTCLSCELPAVADSLCGKHYYRKRTNGSPEKVRRQNGNRTINKDGYVILGSLHPDNPSGKRAYEHKIVMEAHLERKLVKGENVHHKNGVRSDNRLENLELWSSSQPPGQRVEDKVIWAREILALYDGKKFSA